MSRYSAGEMGDLMHYDDIVARIYADKRMPSGTRELALVLAWTALRDPGRHDTTNMAPVRRILGGDDRLRQLFAEDCPRYEHPRAWGGACDGPRLRAYKPRPGTSEHYSAHVEQRTADNTRCGSNASEHVHEYDMTTGQVSRTWWFCSRHKALAVQTQERIAARGAPPPAIPNCGGLLACYFERAQVQDRYQWARPWWKPPYHGICADDWPLPGVEVAPQRPRLALIIGGLEA